MLLEINRIGIIIANFLITFIVTKILLKLSNWGFLFKIWVSFAYKDEVLKILDRLTSICYTCPQVNSHKEAAMGDK